MAKKRRKKQEEEGGGDSWLMTYGDMMTLLLTFFVLLLSFSTMEVQKFRSAMGSLKGALGISSTVASMVPTDQAIQFPSTGGRPPKIDNHKVQKEMEEIQSMIDSMGIEEQLQLKPSEDGILIKIDTELMFDPGEAVIYEQFYPVLDKLGKLTKSSNNLIIVEGHTDNNPISTTIYPSNWELSGARAARIIRYFIKENDIEPDRFVMKGYAEYRPVANNKTEEGRAKNRRVEILIKNNNEEEEKS